MLARVPWSIRIAGVVFVAAAVWAAAWIWWHGTRQWTPLDTPLKLASGQVIEPAFRVNATGGYVLSIDTPVDRPDQDSAAERNRADCSDLRPNVVAAWRMLRNGQEVARGSAARHFAGCPGDFWRPEIGTVHLTPGEYVIGLDLAVSGPEANSVPARLRLEADWNAQGAGGDFAVLGLLIAFCALVALVWLCGRCWVERRRAAHSAWLANGLVAARGPQPRNLQVSATPLSLDDAALRLVRPATLWTGILMIVALGALDARLLYQSFQTRAVVIDRPVSLRAGHARIGPFRIEPYNEQLIEVIGDRSGNSPFPGPQTRWTLLRDGLPYLGSGPVPKSGAEAGTFQVIESAAENWWFSLDLEILQDARDLDRLHPHVIIWRQRYPYEYEVDPAWWWVCALGMGAGAYLMLIGLARRFPRPFGSAPLPAVAPCEGPRVWRPHVRWTPRRPSPPLCLGLRTFPLVTVLTLSYLWCIPQLMDLPNPIGLRVHLARPGAIETAQPMGGLTPILVQVDEQHRVFVNWAEVPWQALPAVLAREMKTRPPHWPVFVEGHPANDLMYPVRAMDAIQGAGGKVMLLTTWRGKPVHDIVEQR
jgi:biopolymer transport protein ExbD